MIAEDPTLWPIAHFLSEQAWVDHLPTYWYEGRCPRSGDWLRLPRTGLIEAIAQGLMRQLAKLDLGAEGKMYGVLLVQTPGGERGVLKAFSGLLRGASTVPGWVPAIPGREQVALAERQTLQRLAAIKAELETLQHLPERGSYEQLCQSFRDRWQQLTARHRQHKHTRHQQRQNLYATLEGEALVTALQSLERQSQQEGRERRQFKQDRDRQLKPLAATLNQADQQMQALKQERWMISRALQQQMHAAYRLSNFAGETLPLSEIATQGGLPTGSGECCAPKLLHYAATQGWQPLAMAEFWWGAATVDRQPGQFYPACRDRCQPLMGFLLSGLSAQVQASQGANTEPLPLIYEDEWLLAIDKPPGLLSVPGRYGDRQDSALLRLRQHFPTLLPVHRLDQATSGVLLFAKDRLTQRQLYQHFQQRQMHKAYEALLSGHPQQRAGSIALPLWGNPAERPRQTVDWQRGKASLTTFRTLAIEGAHTRLELIPHTGRTHQLRVHAAASEGLNCAILGDRLYGCTANAKRLYLHGREVVFVHPYTQTLVTVRASTPF